MSLAGLPPTIAYAGTSLTTTDPIAMIAPSPTCTFPQIMTSLPIHTKSSITTFFCVKCEPYGILSPYS